MSICPFLKLSSSSAVALKSCLALASMSFAPANRKQRNKSSYTATKAVYKLKYELCEQRESYFRFKFIFIRSKFICISTESIHSEIFHINYLTCFNLNGYSSMLHFTLSHIQCVREKVVILILNFGNKKIFKY